MKLLDKDWPWKTAEIIAAHAWLFAIIWIGKHIL